MSIIPDLPHQAEFEKWLKGRFPFMSLHRTFVPSGRLGGQQEWQYGVEWVQAMYEAYCAGRMDEWQDRLRKHKVYTGSGNERGGGL